METMTKMMGVVCALGALMGCAETQTAAHATTAAALSDDDVADKKPVVRLRMEAAEDSVQQAAFTSVRRTLIEQGFVVGSGFTDGHDADVVIRSSREGALTRISLAARLGSRAMVPVTVDVAGDGGAADEDALSDMAMRWQRRFNRSPRLDRHIEADFVSLPSFTPGASRSVEGTR